MAGLDALQRSELYAQVLVRFITNLHGGVIDENLWAKLRDDMLTFEKLKAPSGKDYKDQWMRLSETLAASTPHNISFQLLTTMLRRIIGEVSSSQATGTPANADSHGRNGVSLRSQYTKYFQDLLFRPRGGEGSNTGKEASRNAARRVTILEICVSEGIDYFERDSRINS